jgi:hypothetical protein
MKRLLAATALTALAAAGSAASNPAQTGQSELFLHAIAENFQLVDQNHDAWELRYFDRAPAISLASHAVGDAPSVETGKTLAELQQQYGHALSRCPRRVAGLATRSTACLGAKRIWLFFWLLATRLEFRSLAATGQYMSQFCAFGDTFWGRVVDGDSSGVQVIGV